MTRAALYSMDDVEQTVKQFKPVAYDSRGRACSMASTATFRDAGHILGSAIIELHGDRRGRRRPPSSSPATSAAATRRSCATRPRSATPTSCWSSRPTATASTRRTTQAIEELATAINEVATDRGVLLVPSFAIGRTQELVWVLDELYRDKRIPRLPLYLDSPMASRASDVYLRHPEDYDEETAALLRPGDSPLVYPGETYTNEVDQSKAIRTQPRPLMLVASSGMLTGGRIMHHLKDFLPDAACTLLFIGYQGEGTLGRAIQGGAKVAKIDGVDYPIRCRVRVISGFSAHADEHELDDWLGNFAKAGGSDRRPMGSRSASSSPTATPMPPRPSPTRIRATWHLDAAPADLPGDGAAALSARAVG